MNKEDRVALDKKIQKKLNPFFTEQGFQLDAKLFRYQKNNVFVFWSARAEFEDWLSYEPWFKIVNDHINKVFKKVFPERISYFSSVRMQNTVAFAHEFNIHDFNGRPYDIGIGTVRFYKYKIHLDTNLNPIIKDHIEFMEKVTFLYFEKLNTVRGISEYFNKKLLDLTEKELRNERVQDRFQKEEVLSAIIAAYLEKEKGLYQIIERYEKLYSKNDWYLNDIIQLKNWIIASKG